MRRSPPSRYKTRAGLEGQFEPGSRRHVLRNPLGIRNKRQMDQAEHDALLSVQLAYVKKCTPETRFTAALICRMHRDWLGGIYEWAGRYRTVELSKGGFQWSPAYRIAQNMKALEVGALRRCTPCRPGPVHEAACRIAEVHGELLLIHPFREGNGRLARWVADLMALQASLPLPDYGFTGRKGRARRQRYLQAVKKSYLGDLAPLRAFFEDALRRRRGLKED